MILSQAAIPKPILTINLSSTLLTPNKLSLLERGLNFAPNPKSIKHADLLDCKNKLIRNLLLKTFLATHQKTLTILRNGSRTNQHGYLL